VYNYTIMSSEKERQKIEEELKDFTSRNFESPGNCRNPEQINFYVNELRSKIVDYEARFNYVPEWVYTMLAQYDVTQKHLPPLKLNKVNSKQVL
jgi:hypothetical protein